MKLSFLSLVLLSLSFAFQTVSLAAPPPAKTPPTFRKPSQITPSSEYPPLVRDIVYVYRSYSEKGDEAFVDPDFKTALVNIGLAVQNSGRLYEGLDTLSKAASHLGLIQLDEKARLYLVKTISSAVHAELQQRGLTEDGNGRQYETWDVLSFRIQKEIASLPGLRSGLRSESFVKNLKKLSQAQFSNNNQVSLLINGPESFKKRAELLESAKKEILIMSWSIEDDTTGVWLKEKLSQKLKENVSIKIIVDGQTAERIGYSSVLKQIESLGIPVLRWRANDPSRIYDGQHRKAMIVDGHQMVAGGLNWGDAYSHLNPKRKGWRDTDIYASGDLVKNTRNIFISLWNTSKKDSAPFALFPNQKTNNSPNNKISAVINHQPGQGENILKAIVLSIESAEQSIHIQNAYFILDPVIETALKRALNRGVSVSIYTNSSESVDEPVVNRPIMKSLNKLLAMNARVFVKNGKDETLHSKVMMVDGYMSWVGSHNFHPRSYRYEGEVLFMILDESFTQGVSEMFSQDLKSMRAISSPIELSPDSIVDYLSSDLFFDQL